MRTIAVINQKGGCGKTTVSVNLAAVLASQGRRTLLVDMDPQGHCALGLAVPEAQVERSIGDLLRAGLDGSIDFGDITWQVARCLDLAPATMRLAGIEQELAGVPDRDRRLLQVLSTVAVKYDYCIIDCPPSIGLLTFNALRAAGEVIVPVETGYYSLQGSLKQEATIEMLARRAGHRVRFKVLATMYDVRTKLAREILSELKRHFGDKLMPVTINFNSKLKEAASFGQPITEYDAASRGHQDFEKLAQWLLENPLEEPTPVEVESVQRPAQSRAAELVERARSLQARASALATRIAADRAGTSVFSHDDTLADAQPTQSSPSAPTPPAPARDEPVPIAAAGEDETASASVLQPVADSLDKSDRLPTPTPSLREKLARMFGVRKTQQGLLFVQPINGAANVAIAGDFNDWSESATPMLRNDQLGVWQACVDIAPGRYRYRLVIDGEWMNDPHNKYVETNPFGELNSIVEVE